MKEKWRFLVDEDRSVQARMRLLPAASATPSSAV